jgi:hypothetical protein
MANWYDNDLTVYGPKVEVERFIGSVKTKDSLLAFEELFPPPSELQIPSDDITNAWVSDNPREASDRINRLIEWEETNWGCGRGTCDAELKGLRYYATYALASYYFRTKWSPPRGFFHWAAQEFRNLTFHLKYGEYCMDHRGEAIWQKGELVHQCDRCQFEGVDYFTVSEEPEEESIDELPF